MIYCVKAGAPAGGDGSRERPFAAISEAAAIAQPGDEVVVAPGIYREWVKPARGGREDARIVYRSEEKGKAVITGAEPLTGWTPVAGEPGVWRAAVPNAVFGEYNPYTTRVSGDWFIAYTVAHTGEVYLNGRAMYEVPERAAVTDPAPSAASWDPDFSVYVWHAEQDQARDETVFYANFHEFDPNAECVEMNARRCCFMPEETGRGYITVSGFRICKAATQWAPPTAYQDGMIGPHWSKGWIIEDCEISDSKCSGISLGKYLQPGDDNKWLHEKTKDGTQTQRDCVLRAWREGWSKETVGSHVVRRCEIHDCGQTGIVGHMGGVFSVIEDCHIHHVNNRQNLTGAEIGGIKMHAAIDVVFRRNHIHHCTRGIWLDWQAQGTRVTECVFHDNTLPFDYLDSEEAAGGNGEDIFIEVSHGPTLVDHCLLLSDHALKLPTQGVALAHNLIAGGITAVGRGVNNGSPTLPSPRYTPYHMPHSTDIRGFMTFLHGDVRFCNNLFVQRPIRPLIAALARRMRDEEWDDGNPVAGTVPYEAYPTEEEWKATFEGYCGMGSPKTDRYYAPLPVWFEGNAYLAGAQHCQKEENFSCDPRPVTLRLESREGRLVLVTDLYDHLPETATRIVSTATLGRAFEPEQDFENPDGTPIVMDHDFLGEARGAQPLPGPFARGGAEIVLPL